jgi:RNA polymerase sigma-70 factor, ECF subfamily
VKDKRGKANRGSPDSDSDEALVKRLGRGDAAAFQVLMTRYASLHLGFAHRLVGNRQEAEDIVQESYAKLWTHGKDFDPRKSKFTTWFYRVVMNRCLDHKRKKRAVALPEAFDAADDAPSAHQLLEASERAEQVREALERIPERQKAAIVLCYFEGVSNREAAEILGVNLKALESLLCRGRRSLQGFLRSFVQ